MAMDVEHRDGIAVLRFANAENMNSFDPEALRGIRAAITDAMNDAEVSGIVLTGTGRAFCTGADVGEFRRHINEGTIAAFIQEATGELHPLMMEMHASGKPIVAAINGVAAGGGLGLALAADERIGSEAARFASGYFGIGASPDGGSTWFMPRLIGTQRTRRFFYDNEVMGADEAVATGLMDALVPADSLVGAAVERAARMAAWAAHSRTATAELLESALHLDLEAQLRREQELIVDAGTTPDFQEGVSAFLEKRTPAFQP